MPDTPCPSCRDKDSQIETQLQTIHEQAVTIHDMCRKWDAQRQEVARLYQLLHARQMEGDRID